MKTMRSRKTLSFILCIALAVSMTAAAFVYGDSTYPQDIRTEYTADYSGKTVILHTNDVHGALDGYAKAARLKSDLEKLGAEVLLVDGGDFMQGDLYVSKYKGLSAVKLMNEAGYDYSTIGNHDFDYTVDSLEKAIDAAEFKMICANAEKDGKQFLPADDIYETMTGLKIGFFGLDTPETKTKSSSGNTIGMSFLEGDKLTQCAENEASSLKARGADLVIALTHLGVDTESIISGNSAVSVYEKAKSIDFIIDGHSHTVMTAGNKGETIQSTGTKFEYIGLIAISEDGKIEDHYLIPTDGLEADEKIKASADEIMNRIDSEYAEVFAESELYFTGEKADNRCHETNSGDLMTDSMYWYIRNHPECCDGNTDKVIAIQNGGGIRSKIDKGDVTKKDIINVSPFNNTVCLVKASGEELLELLEASTFCTPDPVGGFPHTKGMKWTVDTTKEYDAGKQYPDSTYYAPATINRVSIQDINGRAFDPKAEYYIVSSDFSCAGGDTYGVLKGKTVIDTGVQQVEILIGYITDDLDAKLTAEKYGKDRGDITIITAPVEETAPAAETAPVTETSQSSQQGGVYVVKQGDYLVKIAREQLGDPLKWRMIYNLNSKKIKDPNLIYPGQEFRLPDAI